MIEKRMSNMFLSKEEIRAMMDRAIDKKNIIFMGT